jgi:hypothetical protein
MDDVPWKLPQLFYFRFLPYEIVVGAEICGQTHNPLQVHPQQNDMTIKCSACLGDSESVEFFELACQHPNWHPLWVICLKDALFWTGRACNFFFILNCFPASAISSNDIADILEGLSFDCGSWRPTL